jgi:DNA polymerase-1
LLFSARTKIGHNLKFDLESIAKYYGGAVPPGPYTDTLILTHVLDENLDRYDLKNLVMDWLRIPRKAEIRAAFYPNLGKTGVETQSIDDVARYLAKDVWYTHLFARTHLTGIKKFPKLWDTFQIEMAVYPSIMQMELNGIRIDVDLLRARGAELSLERQAIAERIWTICGEEYAISNPHKKRQFLFGPKNHGGQGLKPLFFTQKTNTPQLNTTTLEFYAPTNELSRLFLEWAEKEKLIGTFIEGLEKKLVNGRLHTSFNQHRTVTGRLSSNNPNLQQIPRGDLIRGTFIADEGTTLVVADYDQVELRCAAFLSQDAEMIRVFQEGMDIHTQAAAAMYGIDPDQVGDERQVGKTMNFGTLFGAGPTKIASVASTIRPCDIPQAQEFIRRYYAQFSGLAKWKDDMVTKARRTGSRKQNRAPYTEIPPWGRKRRLPALYSGDDGERAKAERQVVNAIVQGFAATIMKMALIDLHAHLAKWRLPYKVLLNVHDEVIMQCPSEAAAHATSTLVAVMEEVTYNGDPILGTVPLTAAAGVGQSWSDAK